jgi:pimeloyl-ACP methyl ester carboxylesterase
MRPLTLLISTLSVLGAATLPGVAPAPARAAVPAWSDCRDGFQCASVPVPVDYRRPRGEQLRLALVRLPASDPGTRIGSLFLNPGGPGASGVHFVRDYAKNLFAPLNRRFDLVGWDPRGVGESGAIDCGVDQRRAGTFSQPFAAEARLLVRRARGYGRRCVARSADPGLLPYVHTANSARDLERLRAAVGDAKLSFLGYSHGTQLGATYATFFPSRVRALVLDGAVDILRHPLRAFRERAAAFEDALGRFLNACAGRPDRCGLGTDPRAGYDALVARLDGRPLPAPGPQTVDGDDLLAATYGALTQKFYWPTLSDALVAAQAGDGGPLKAGTDAFYANITDPYPAISALDARWPARPAPYLRANRRAKRTLPHFWWQAGSVGLPMGLWPVHAEDAFFGRMRNSERAPTALVVGTTHDPSTPYAWARRMTSELGNARLLTMRGDGHTASFNDNTPCIDDAVLVYLERLTLPAEHATCTQEVPF